MRHSRLLLLALTVTACTKDAALRLVITTAPQRPDSCFEVTLRPATGDDVLSTATLVADGGSTYAVVVYQAKSVPDDVRFDVQAWVSNDGCAAPHWGNGSVSVPAHFSPGVTSVEARLDALPDSDGDLTVDEVDCAPDAGWRGQSIAEHCNTRLDYDCDGFVACNDADCGAQPCISSLALLDGGVITAGACVSQTVALFNAGEPITPAAPVSVAFSASNPSDTSFFDAPGCGAAASSVSVAGTSAAFSFKARRAGAVTLNASANNWGGATAEYTVVAGPPFAVSVDAGEASTWRTNTCIPLTATWTDEFGNPVSGAAIQASSAETTVYSNNTCTQSGALTMGDTLYIAPADEGDVTVYVSSGTTNGSATLHVLRPFVPGSLTRWPLVVHTFQNSPFKGYAGYTVGATFDAGVPAGQLRAYFWADAGWQLLGRVANASTVSFALQTDLDAGADDRRYSVFAMAPLGPEATDDLDGTYLFADGFDDAPLAKWRQRDGGFVQSSAQVYSGTGALFFGKDTTDRNNFIEPATPLYERDVMVCSRWRADTDTGLDFAQLVRLQTTSDEDQELNRETTHWKLARQNAAGDWTAYNNSSINGPISFWDEICVAEWDTDAGTTLAGWRNGTLLGSEDATAVHSGPGTVGYRRWRTDNGGIYLDDFRVRRYIAPEPSVTVLPPLPAP